MPVSHLTTRFIERAAAVHGTKYDYKQAIYTMAKLKLCIICPAHGAFMQSPNVHLRGVGCPTCGLSKRASSKRKAAEASFIEKARSVHGIKYDYAKSKYRAAHEHVAIGCALHGDFLQQPTAHLNGRGCPACGRLAVERARTHTKESFIAKARITHGDKYDYSKLELTRLDKSVTIICPTHGPFHQRRSHHLAGHGCDACAKEASWFEKAGGRPGMLYFIEVSNDRELFYKVGVTYRTLRERFEGQHPLGAYNYRIIAAYFSLDTKAVWEWEQAILSTFIHLKYTPTVLFEGYSECFSEAEPILAALPFGTIFFD